MKTGDLIQLDEVSYPQYINKIGMLVEAIPAKIGTPERGKFGMVMIGEKLHPYVVSFADMKLVNWRR